MCKKVLCSAHKSLCCSALLCFTLLYSWSSIWHLGLEGWGSWWSRTVYWMCKNALCWLGRRILCSALLCYVLQEGREDTRRAGTRKCRVADPTTLLRSALLWAGMCYKIPQPCSAMLCSAHISLCCSALLSFALCYSDFILHTNPATLLHSAFDPLCFE